ncbi:Indoleamine 2,3-dioxygenase [Crassisporium funariophilum]|nr:Indoleamine 2,3-dioxygenase [Crassisporium funariophilum]
MYLLNDTPPSQAMDSLTLEHLKTSIPVAHVFDVDQRTGFMAPEPPLSRLPDFWEAWEANLDAAVESKIQLGDKVGLTDAEATASRVWRERVSQAPILSTIGLMCSPILLRRAHLVLAYTLHFYVQSLPPNEPVLIPRSISIPILHVSKKLDIPPILTFSDTVLYNWDFRPNTRSENAVPHPDTIRTQTMFTRMVDEEEFYLCSARIELRGVEILELMRVTMDETFLGDKIAVRRITDYLQTIAGVINELKALLLDVKKLCDPDVYYNQVRPWFRGEDSSENKREWVFQGVDDDPELRTPKELSGPSAGQSSIIHVFDIFLGVDHQATSPGKPSFMSRMQSYMPHNHRSFLNHLKSNPRPLRTFVMNSDDADLLAAFNHAVLALKEFRDAHMIIAALYILGPARRAAKLASRGVDHADEVTSSPSQASDSVKGTGGTDLVKFLKDTRNRTNDALIIP